MGFEPGTLGGYSIVVHLQLSPQQKLEGRDIGIPFLVLRFSQDFHTSVHFLLTSAVDESQKHKKNWECLQSNLGLLGEKQEFYLCAMLPPPPPLGK